MQSDSVWWLGNLHCCCHRCVQSPSFCCYCTDISLMLVWLQLQVPAILWGKWQYLFAPVVVQQIAKVLQHGSGTVENQNWFTTYESDYLSWPQHALPLCSSTINQLWFSTVQLACCKTFAICYSTKRPHRTHFHLGQPYNAQNTLLIV